MSEEKIFRIKAHMDALKDNTHKILDLVFDNIPNQYDDDVFEFDLIIRNVKDITKAIGVNKEGGRAFDDVEIKELQHKRT